MPICLPAPCTLPPLPPSLPPSPFAPYIAQSCGKQRQEFHWGNLLHSHTPAGARIFSLSLNLPRFAIPLLSPSICAVAWGAPCPQPRVPTPLSWLGQGCLAGDLGKPPHSLCLSFFICKTRRMTVVATSRLLWGFGEIFYSRNTSIKRHEI